MVLRNHYGKGRDVGQVPRAAAADRATRAIEDAQGAAACGTADSPPAREGRRRSRDVVIAAAVLGVLLAPPVVARTGDLLREGTRNGTATQETEIIGNFNATGAPKGSYVTRQSNTRTGPRAGGAAVYGCRGARGGTSAGSAPCLRASNLADGFAFEFAADGPAGLFSVGNPAQASPLAPFATNATGVVTNLNADKVDGLDATQLIASLPAGPAGPAGPTGPAGPAGPTGPTGPTGSPGTALAWARVQGDGTVDATEGIDPSKIRRASTGVYCFDTSDIVPPPRIAIATPLDYGGFPDASARIAGTTVITSGSVSGCSERAVVVTRLVTTQAEIDTPFSVVFEG